MRTLWPNLDGRPRRHPAHRDIIQVEGPRLSIARGDLTWEQNIFAALHRLKSPAVVNDTPGRRALNGEPHFDLAHKAFHRAA